MDDGRHFGRCNGHFGVRFAVHRTTKYLGAYHIQSFRHLIRFLAFQNLYQLLKKTSDKKIFLRRIEYIPPIILKKISTYLFVFTYLRNKPTYNISSLATLKKFKIVSFKYCLSCLGENVIFDNPK